jgi:hydrogenase maturation protease
VQIVGIGSASGCDALGWLAAERLAGSDWGSHVAGEPIGISACATPAQLPALPGTTRLLILIDALLDHGPAGRVLRLHPEELAKSATTSSHGVGVAEALALIDVLHGETVAVTVLGISTGNAPAGSEVATETCLERAWPALEVALDEVVGNYMRQRGQPPSTAAAGTRAY